jgi:hypothetical protein
MENFGKLVTIVLSMIFSVVITGFVFAKLWLWFIVPIFQFQPLRLVESIGIIVLISFVMVKQDNSVTNGNFWDKFVDSIMFTVVSSGLALLCGWIVTLFL